MRVAIVGAGALGGVYGALLALEGGCEVSVVGRAPGPGRAERLESVKDGEVRVWGAPPRTAVAGADVDVCLACVRYEQLAELPGRVGAGACPVVVLTPMMPQDHAQLAAALPGRVVPAMPGVVSYRNEAGALRYWLPRSATTWIDDAAGGVVGADLARHLGRAGIHARTGPRVLERNVATTVSFVPLAMALDVAGSVDALLADAPLLALALRATRQGQALGRSIGEAEAWAAVLLRFVGPRSLRLGLGLARARAPEAVAYAEQHFGRKLHAQNVAMARRIVELARTRGTGEDALEELLGRLERR